MVCPRLHQAQGFGFPVLRPMTYGPACAEAAEGRTGFLRQYVEKGRGMSGYEGLTRNTPIEGLCVACSCNFYARVLQVRLNHGAHCTATSRSTLTARLCAMDLGPDLALGRGRGKRPFHSSSSSLHHPGREGVLKLLCSGPHHPHGRSAQTDGHVPKKR